MALADWVTYARGKVNALLLPDTCDILNPVRVRDSRGGDDEPLGQEVRAAGVPCRVAPITRITQGAEGGGLYGARGPSVFSLDSSASSWWLYLPHGTPLAVGEHARLTSGLASGQRFEVIEVEDADGFAAELRTRVVRAGVTNAEGE